MIARSTSKHLVRAWGQARVCAKYLEFGTSKMPARPFLGGALIAKEHEIGDGVLAEVKKAFEK
jgi:hypothetical protein